MHYFSARKLFWLADSSLIFKIGTLVLDVIHHLGTYCRSDGCNRGLLFANLGKVVGIHVGSVHLKLKQADQLAVAVAVLTVQDNFAQAGQKSPITAGIVLVSRF
jgi:hypothetical protein